MSRKCEVTGKIRLVGNLVSHSNIKTKHRQYPNLQKKTFIDPESGKKVTLKLCAKAIRTISKNGLIPTLKKSNLLHKLS